MKKLIGTLAALALALSGLTFVASTAALAYPPCQSGATATVTPSSGNGGQTVTFSGTFKDCNGGAVAGSNVVFSQQSGPANCTVTFSPTSVVTDANGNFSTTVTLPANCPGTYVLAASTQGVAATATVRENGGFPVTTGGPESPAGFPTAWLLLVLATFLAASGATLLVRGRK